MVEKDEQNVIEHATAFYARAPPTIPFDESDRTPLDLDAPLETGCPIDRIETGRSGDAQIESQFLRGFQFSDFPGDS